MINAINCNISTNTYLDIIKKAEHHSNDFEKLLVKDEDSHNYSKDKYVKISSDTNSYEKSNIYTRNGTETYADNKSNDVETNSEIIVKSDGSRVLVITTKIGGMETSMSIELSKPTNMFNTENETVEKNDYFSSLENALDITN